MPNVPQFSHKRLSDLIEKRAGNKVKKLAEKIGVTPQTIHNWKKGTHMPDPTQLMLLADILFADLTEFFDPPDTVQ